MPMSLSRPVIVSRLRQDPTFASLSDEDLDSLAAVMSYREYQKGAFIVTKNETADEVDTDDVQGVVVTELVLQPHGESTHGTGNQPDRQGADRGD